jgi:ABC-type phosphate transport system substrate-binding protein
MRHLKLALAALAVAVAAPALAEDFKVVANPAVPIESISRTQLSDLFLKRSSTYPGGAAAVPVDLAEGNKTFEAFAKTVHNKPGAVIRAFWKKVSASGRDAPPPVRQTDEDVVAFVRNTPGAIGYVSPAAATAGVKVLKVE